MLGFLGKFRRKNIKETKMKKIIFYAFGEILLLVLGILIAVQLNNWNTSRKLEQAEDITLNRLYEDLLSDTQRFEFLDSAIQHQISLADSAIQLIEEQKTYQDRLNIIRIAPIEIFILETNTATYDEMINTGRLYSLSSRRLRSWISLYYRQANKWGAYSDGNTNRLRTAINQPMLNDYWTIQEKLERNKFIGPSHYPWLSQQSSDELKEIENLMYLTSAILQQNLGNFKVVKSIRERLKEEIKIYMDEK